MAQITPSEVQKGKKPHVLSLAFIFYAHASMQE